MPSVARLIFTVGLLALTSLIGQAEAQTAQPGACLFTHFKTKSPACADEVLGLSASVSPGAFDPGMPPIGFLAEVFLRSPTERARILAAPDRPGSGVFILTALLRAGLAEEAGRFAADAKLQSLFERMRALQMATLPEITATGTAASKDTEFLAGAYGASGSRRYLDLILAAFDGADERDAAIGLRLGLLTAKWGAAVAPTGHRSQILRNFCTQVDCKAKQPDAMRILGLMAAYGTVSTIAREDAETKKVLDAAFAKRKALKDILAAEQAYLTNYGTALTVARLLTGGPGENVAAREAALRSIETYESFGPLPQALPGADAADARP